MLTELSAPYKSLYADPMNGYLYFIWETVDQFDAAIGSKENWVWKGKEIELQTPVNFGCAKVEWTSTKSVADTNAAYAVYLGEVAANQAIINAGIYVGAFGGVGFNTDPINGATELNAPTSLDEFLYYTLLSHDQAVFSKLITPGEMFRLPAGYKTDVITHQLSGNVRCKYLKIAETPSGLKQV